MVKNWIGIVYFVIVSHAEMTRAIKEYEETVTKNSSEKPRVELRAVFLSCTSEDPNASPDSVAMRFEREELFKHGILKECVKKLALTVKLTSESESPGDEYLPIEHVFDGSSDKRIRLLDPYILRLHRDLPLQAYKLSRAETVRGLLLNNNEPEEMRDEVTCNRFQRDAEYVPEVLDGNKLEVDELNLASIHSESLTESPQIKSSLPTVSSMSAMSTMELASQELKDNNDVYLSHNDILNERTKRSEHNIVVETVTAGTTKWDSMEHFHRIVERDQKKHTSYFDDEANIDEISHKLNKIHHKREKMDSKHVIEKNASKKVHYSRPKNSIDSIDEKPAAEEMELKEDPPKPVTKVTTKTSDSDKRINNKMKKNPTDVSYAQEKDYAVYEIGAPEIWHTVQVQLFEKLSSPEGKTVWNDLTKGDLASVGSESPEWTGQDLNVRYRSTKWIPREDFTLPMSRLCLLIPINDNQYDSLESNSTIDNGDKGCVVVPEEDIVGLNEEDVTIRDDNASSSETYVNASEVVEQKYRRVMVRMSRAIINDYENILNIASRGNEKYLTLPHKKPHSAQIDVEARADDNELVRIGSSGRISIAVADSTRKTRTIINVQVGNTGLAAARFSVVARDMDPPLSDLVKENEFTIAGPILIPPRHTRSLRLEFPIEIPVDVLHCSVSLLNEDDLSVAVRDVTIKKGDRCFCVWHCSCVCLSDDPKLMCRDMDEAGQKAAGLSTRDRPRLARSVYCNDVVSIDLCVIATGVLILLLLLGLIKAMLGLLCHCFGNWGLHLLLQTPRRLDNYYEKTLRCRTVVYDNEGWPVHPDTGERTVRLVSLPMELFLNSIFFISLPCIMTYDLIRHFLARFSSSSKECHAMSENKNSNKCYSTHDMQAVGRRRRGRRERLRRWMTPQAQQLSAELWEKSLNVRFLQPLLHEKCSRDRPRECVSKANATQDSLPDSEQDDTDYVLTQMQKSRESLARSQKKLCDLDPSAIATCNKQQTLHAEDK